MTKASPGGRPLARGQIWKTRAARIEIVALGKSLLHYRITKELGAQSVSAQISGIPAMESYLQMHQARLIRGASNN